MGVVYCVSPIEKTTPVRKRIVSEENNKGILRGGTRTLRSSSTQYQDLTPIENNSKKKCVRVQMSISVKIKNERSGIRKREKKKGEKLCFGTRAGPMSRHRVRVE